MKEQSSRFLAQVGIKIQVIWEGQEYDLVTYTNEYRNLMMLVLDQLGPEGYGECLGMGKCGTCLIEIVSGGEGLTDFDRNESATLQKHGIAGTGQRLACQILITEALDGLTIKV